MLDILFALKLKNALRLFASAKGVASPENQRNIFRLLLFLASFKAKQKRSRRINIVSTV